MKGLRLRPIATSERSRTNLFVGKTTKKIQKCLGSSSTVSSTANKEMYMMKPLGCTTVSKK